MSKRVVKDFIEWRKVPYRGACFCSPFVFRGREERLSAPSSSTVCFSMTSSKPSFTWQPRVLGLHGLEPRVKRARILTKGNYIMRLKRCNIWRKNSKLHLCKKNVRFFFLWLLPQDDMRGGIEKSIWYAMPRSRSVISRCTKNDRISPLFSALKTVFDNVLVLYC